MNQLFSANRQASIKKWNVVFFANIFYGSDIFHTHRLPSTGIISNSNDAEGNIFGTFFGNECFESLRIHIAFEGCGHRGSFPSAQRRSTPSAPVTSILARVVSKRVLLTKYFPLPPSTLNRIFSAALPWCVGITNGMPVIS